MRLFAQLGALIETRWRNKNYDENLFPGIAALALSELKVSDQVDPWEIIRWVHATPDLPMQMDIESKFGNPPITLYVGPRFYIDAYYWLDGTTSIHQHAFSGAFQVLHGSSVHAGYTFEKHQEINPRFLVGKLSLNTVSLLTKGAVREIHPGSGFIHSLFHLERPSVTITIRTYKAPGASVQYSYMKPYLARDPFFIEQSLMKKVDTVELLLRMKHPDADSFIAELIDSSDFQTTYSVLKAAFGFLCHRELEELLGVARSRDRFEALLDRARSRHGELVDLLVPVFEEEWRQNDIRGRRAEIKHEDHRFFLALLLNVPHRTEVLRLVKERFPDKNPIDLVVDWVRQLSATKIFGSREPNVLGIENFDDIHLLVFKGLLEGLGNQEIKTRLIAEKVFEGASEAVVTEVANQLRGASLFNSLFTKPEGCSDPISCIHS